MKPATSLCIKKRSFGTASSFITENPPIEEEMEDLSLIQNTQNNAVCLLQLCFVIVKLCFPALTRLVPN